MTLNRTGVLLSRVIYVGFLASTYWVKGVVICWAVVCCLSKRDQSPQLRTRGEWWGRVWQGVPSAAFIAPGLRVAWGGWISLVLYQKYGEKSYSGGYCGLTANEGKLFPTDGREPGSVGVCRYLLLHLGLNLLKLTKPVMLEGRKKLNWVSLCSHFSFSLTFLLLFSSLLLYAWDWTAFS